MDLGEFQLMDAVAARATSDEAPIDGVLNAVFVGWLRLERWLQLPAAGSVLAVAVRA